MIALPYWDCLASLIRCIWSARSGVAMPGVVVLVSVLFLAFGTGNTWRHTGHMCGVARDSTGLSWSWSWSWSWSLSLSGPFFWPLTWMTRGVTHCMHAVENNFEAALHSLAQWVVQDRSQAIENKLVQQNSIRQGPGPVAPSQERGGLTGPAATNQWAWEGPYLVNGLVNRPVSVPKVLIFYGIPAIAAKARVGQTRLNFHLTLGRVREDLLGGKEEANLFTAEQIAVFMRGRAQLACGEGLFHQAEVAMISG